MSHCAQPRVNFGIGLSVSAKKSAGILIGIAWIPGTVRVIFVFSLLGAPFPNLKLVGLCLFGTF